MAQNSYNVNLSTERHERSLIVDTRPFFKKVAESFANPDTAAITFAAVASLAFIFPHLVELVFLFSIGLFFFVRSAQKSAGLALRMPKTSNESDPKEIPPGGGNKPVKADGIIYLGNDQDTGEEVWMTDTMARTHMLVMGTTGSGKTEHLVSLVFNSLIHGSGLIYVDGKADSSLYGKIYSMARSMGREDDVLVINFQTGAKDIYGPQTSKLSNTLNPFAVGSAGMLQELIKGLMQTGENSTWTQQAEQFVEAIIKPLVYLRDHAGLMLDVNVMRDFFDMDKLEDLAWKDLPWKTEAGPGIEEYGILDGVRNYLKGKPGYKVDNYHNQSETTHEQHGYIRMQLSRTFGSLADTYGYIMKTPLAEIDFVDVFLNRRILVVLLPALEKSPAELTNLGRIVVASLKATMAMGLGAKLEGDWSKVIESKPTRAPSPFMCVLDEYGYYAVEGFAVVPAQARSLGFSAIFAGQDLPAFEKASKEEAASTLANTNTRFCGKLECTKTYEFFKDIAGSGLFTKLRGYEYKYSEIGQSFRADENISVDRIARVPFEALRGQVSGQWHLFFANQIIRLKSFYSNPKPVKQLRVNHFIRVARPTREEIQGFVGGCEMFTRALRADGGLSSYMDRVSTPSDILDLLEGMEHFSSQGPFVSAAKALGYCTQAEEKRAADFAKTLSAGAAAFGEFSQGLGNGILHDFAGDIASAGHQRDHADDDDGMMPFIEPKKRDEANDNDQQDELISQADELRVDDASGRPIEFDASSAPSPVRHQGDQEARFGRDFLDDIPDDVVNAPTGPTNNPVADYIVDDEVGGGQAQEDRWVESADEERAFDVDEPGEMRLSRGPILTKEEDWGREEVGCSDVFGTSAPPPEYITIEDDFADAPPDETLGDDVDQEVPAATFDAPSASEGLLDREATVSGISAIEQSLGAPEVESIVTANAVSESLAQSTKYRATPPSTSPSLEDFESVARKLSRSLISEDDD